MLLSLILSFQYIFYVNCEVWTRYDLPPNRSDLEPYLSTCALKAGDLKFRAFRLKRSDLSCEPLKEVTQGYSHYRITQDSIYVTKQEVRITECLEQRSPRICAGNIPIFLEDKCEISIAFTPGKNVPSLMLSLKRQGDLGITFMIDTDTSISYESSLDSKRNTDKPGLNYTYTPGEMSVVTLRCNSTKFETLVDGKLLHSFDYVIAPSMLDKLLLRLIDDDTTFHYIRYLAA